MPITDYVTYDEIRAVLGVSDEELEDLTLGLPIYEKILSFELGDISPNLESLYASISASSSPTATESKLLDVVSVFSAYAISKYLLTSIPLFAPKTITDGRAQTDRVTDPFSTVRDGVNFTYGTLKGRIQTLLLAIEGVSSQPAARVYSSSAGLYVNPVTGI
jgi:hypothetical protein